MFGGCIKKLTRSQERHYYGKEESSKEEEEGWQEEALVLFLPFFLFFTELRVDARSLFI